MSQTVIQKTALYVKLKLYHEPSGHDWFHVERVWRMAKHLQTIEGGDLELVELMALLHNLGDYSDTARFIGEHKGSLALSGMMDILEIEDSLKEKIIGLVTEVKYKGSETKPPPTIEGKIVQDANLLDTLGAIGIARAFASGGYHRRPIYDPEIPARKNLNKDTYQNKKQEGTSMNSFFEKALRVPALLNTATAKKIAAERVLYIQSFIDQFMKEWKGDF